MIQDSLACQDITIVDVVDMAFNAHVRIIKFWIRLGNFRHFHGMIQGHDQRGASFTFEGFLLVAKETEAAVSVLEYPARGFIFLVEDVAGRTTDGSMLLRLEVVYHHGMAVTTDKDYRVIGYGAMVLVRCAVMAMITFVNDGVDARVGDFGQKKQRLVGAVAFDASCLMVFNVQKTIMISQVDLREIPGPGRQLPVAEKASLERVLLGHGRHFFGNRDVILSLVVEHV
jgi:hypothetical protein